MSYLGDAKDILDMVGRTWRAIRRPGSWKASLPGRTLVVLPEHEQRLWWSTGSVGDKPAMMVVGDFHFTNLHQGPTSVPKTFLVLRHRRWGLLPARIKVEGEVGVRHQSSDVHGRYEIPAGKTSTGRAHWFVVPPVHESQAPVRGRAYFIDRFGNEHWTPVLTFRRLG